MFWYIFLYVLVHFGNPRNPESIGDGVATLGGYNLVARRDRNDGRSGGGILFGVMRTQR